MFEFIWSVNFFKKSWRMRIWYAIIFLSLLAGKIRQIEQSAATSTIYGNSKTQ